MSLCVLLLLSLSICDLSLCDITYDYDHVRAIFQDKLNSSVYHKQVSVLVRVVFIYWIGEMPYVATLCTYSSIYLHVYQSVQYMSACLSVYLSLCLPCLSVWCVSTRMYV